MNTNNGLPSGWTVMQQPKWKPYALQSLIDTNPYPTALAKLQKQKEDCGYTDKWYQDELRKMNKEWRNKVQSAIEENSRYIDEQRAEIAKVRATNFEHRYTERDYADLQFMQNLIKTRIAAEGQNNGVLSQRGMIYRKMAHLPPLIVMTKQNTQYLTRKETRYASSMLIIKKNAQYTNMSIRTMFQKKKKAIFKTPLYESEASFTMSLKQTVPCISKNQSNLNRVNLEPKY